MGRNYLKEILYKIKKVVLKQNNKNLKTFLPKIFKTLFKN